MWLHILDHDGACLQSAWEYRQSLFGLPGTDRWTRESRKLSELLQQMLLCNQTLWIKLQLLVFFNFCWIPFVFYHLMQRRGYLKSSPPSRYSWTRSLIYFCNDAWKSTMRCVLGSVANCPAMPEGNITSGTASLWQTVHPAGCWEKSLPLALLNEQQNLAAVSCLQYKCESMALEKTEIPKGWNSKVEKYHYYDGPTQAEAPGWGDCITEGLFKG